MEDKKNKLKLFKRIGAIVCAFAVAVVAFLVPYFGKNDSKNNIASADEVNVSYSYHSNDMYYISAVALNGWDPVGSMYLLVNCYINYDVTNGLSFRLIQYATETGSLDVQYNLIQDLILYDSNYSLLVEGGSNTYFSIEPGRAYAINSYVNSRSLGFFDYLYCSQGFNANVYKIEMFLSDTCEFYPNGRTGFKFWNIKYYDVNDEYFVQSFLTTSDFYFNSRTYYVQNPDTFTDNQSYNLGYNAGYSAGYGEGETAGYSDGYSSGQSVGYNNGYSNGVDYGSGYTFKSLISAVIDVPVQAFMGLFNFELLGVNLAGFFLSLLSLSIVITVVRMFI